MTVALRLATGLVACLMPCLAPLSGRAEPQPPTPAPPVLSTPPTPLASAPAPALTEADLSAFLAGYVGEQLARDDIAGAVVVVVKDGAVLFQGGFGYADVAAKRPVDPERTGFRIASVTKTFTGTLALQLAGEGKLDLDADVAAYLDFPIERRFPGKITLRTLMTHTAGFGERGKDFIYPTAASLPALGAYLRDHPARQIFAPGTTISYSNYGMALVGYVVERAAAAPWAARLRSAVLEPLGMSRTSGEQPLPEPLAADLSREYGRASLPPAAFQFIPDAPAGSITATGADMARYMIAELGGGPTPILPPALLAEQHRRQFSVSPNVAGIALNFYEIDGNGHHVLAHAGDLARFHSNLVLMPDENVGLFVSYNSTGIGGDRPRDALTQAFLDRYFPDKRPALPTLASAASDARDVAGWYLGTRIARGTVLEPFYVLGSQVEVVAHDDGTISLPGLQNGANGVPKRWREVGPLVWREADGPRQIAFLRDDQGNPRTLAGGATTEGFRVGYWLQRNVSLWLYGVALGLLLAWIALWPVQAVVRWRSRRPLSAELDRRARVERWIARAAALVMLAFLAGWLGFFVSGAANPALLSASADPLLRALQALAVIGCGLAAIALLCALRAWARRQGSLLYRLGLTVAALSCAVLATFVLRFDVVSVSPAY